MRPRDLFEVSIRVIGLVVVAVQLPQLVSYFIDLLAVQPHAAGTPEAYGLVSPYVGFFSEALSTSFGLLLLFGGRIVTRVVYGRDRSN